MPNYITSQFFCRITLMDCLETIQRAGHNQWLELNGAHKQTLNALWLTTGFSMPNSNSTLTFNYAYEQLLRFMLTSMGMYNISITETEKEELLIKATYSGQFPDVLLPDNDILDSFPIWNCLATAAQYWSLSYTNTNDEHITVNSVAARLKTDITNHVAFLSNTANDYDEEFAFLQEIISKVATSLANGEPNVKISVMLKELLEQQGKELLEINEHNAAVENED